MILTGEEIRRQHGEGRIVISPFDAKKVSTNSYDLSLGGEYLVYTSEVLDPARENEYEVRRIPSDGLNVEKSAFILGHSVETIGSNYYVPIIHAKSSIARLGLFIHVTADLIDLGSIGNVTFQMYATMPIRLYANMTIGQVSFWVPKGKIILYGGKYQNSKGVRPSQSYRDFRRLPT
jgi:dCTP deaminase